MVHGLCVAFITQLMVHVYYVKSALVINDIITTFIHERERVLMLKFYLSVVSPQTFINFFSRT